MQLCLLKQARDQCQGIQSYTKIITCHATLYFLIFILDSLIINLHLSNSLKLFHLMFQTLVYVWHRGTFQVSGGSCVSACVGLRSDSDHGGRNKCKEWSLKVPCGDFL